MAQQLPTDYPIDPTVTSGTALADILNRSDEVFNSTNSGPTRPTTIKTGGLWAKTGGAVLELFMFDGATDIPIQSGDFGVSTDAGNITTLGSDGLVFTDGTALDGNYVQIAGDTMTGALVVDSDLSYSGTLTGGVGVIDIGINQIFKDAEGNVGIGKIPTQMFEVAGPASLLSLGVGVEAPLVDGEIQATGNITAYFSDDRLKTKLGDIEDALSKVRTLSGFYYVPNETAQELGYKAVKEVGVSAQQVQVVQPEAVAPAPIDEKYLTVRYERLIPLLIQAIKELDTDLQTLKIQSKG